MGYGVRGLASPHPFLGATRCAVASYSGLDVLVIMQLKFLQCCALTGAGDGQDSAVNREVSAHVLGHGSMPVVVQRQVGWSRQCRKLFSFRSW